MDYFFIAIAVLFCVLQFTVMQFYQKSVKQNFVTGMTLVIVNSATVAFTHPFNLSPHPKLIFAL